MKFLHFVLILVIFVTACQNSVSADSLVNVDRVARQAPATEAAVEPKHAAVPQAKKMSWEKAKVTYNLADPVNEDYPVIFNMILFIAVALVLALIAISVSIATMDPGRDSLIYRVTSGQKAKKDN